MPTWEQVQERTPHVAKAWNDAAVAVAAQAEFPGPVTGGLLHEALALMSDNDKWAIAPEKQGAADAWWERVKLATGPLRKGERFGFGHALAAIKAGHRVAREGWNGKGMWIALTPGSVIRAENARAGAAVNLVNEQRETAYVNGLSYHDDSPVHIGAHIDMRAADGSLVIGWLASQTDMLADDWTVVE